jgi:hypothetical protein
VDKRQREGIDLLERIGYLPQMRRLAMSMCAPFWWHGEREGKEYGIIHNGTISCLNTGSKVVWVTADHVYAQYLKDKDAYQSFGCQFGSSTVEPEKYLIDRDGSRDLATFEVPQVLLAPSGVSVHHPLRWPPERIRGREVVLFGGYPGVLREEKETKAEHSFQSYVSAVTNSSTENIGLRLDLPNLHWPLHEGESFNSDLGGASGGPVFRIVEARPIDRVELAGFIYEYSPAFELMFTRHADYVTPEGRIK